MSESMVTDMTVNRGWPWRSLQRADLGFCDLASTWGPYFLPYMCTYIAHASPISNDSWYGWTAVPEDMIAHTNRAKARGAVQGDTSGCG